MLSLHNLTYSPPPNNVVRFQILVHVVSRSGGQSGLEDRGRGSRILVGAEIEVSIGGNGDGEVKSTVFLRGNLFQVSELTRPVQMFLYYV